MANAQTNLNFHPPPFHYLTIREIYTPKRKNESLLHILSFRCSFLCYISYDVNLFVLLSRNIQILIIQVADEKYLLEAGK